MAQRLKTDWILFAAILLLVALGLVILYSASSIMATVDPRFGWSWHFVSRQVGWAIVSVGIMMALKRTPYRNLNNPALAFGAIGVSPAAARRGLLPRRPPPLAPDRPRRRAAVGACQAGPGRLPRVLRGLARAGDQPCAAYPRSRGARRRLRDLRGGGCRFGNGFRVGFRRDDGLFRRRPGVAVLRDSGRRSRCSAWVCRSIAKPYRLARVVHFRRPAV